MSCELFGIYDPASPDGEWNVDNVFCMMNDNRVYDRNGTVCMKYGRDSNGNMMYIA